ncbi:MAG: MerR family DNA-binding transcriptional regulator [Rhodobacteraceae bacterium]|jgi:DNA-binding transcriptional MerR regulator|uniref:MerR family transcriptional regulator n=1 Tax=uncultured Planktomarina sp. TaxID=1538529 RepID=UPI000E8F90A3|nr:MerR family DNA-binding transcriptional regulator [Paracoccaceae bacterium]MBT6520690.1 MerR family DNA-binding transcriptional regulator [Paracoccaceae bacterium]HBV55384.1 MerR family transcriptional regulator [Paracoccaceae bacterium]
MTQENLSFKDMCAHFNVTPRTLRYYEYIELLQPQRVGRARFYSPREVARMTLIMRGRRFGFSLEELRQWLQIYDKEGSTAQMQAWIPIAQEKLAILKQQQEELKGAITDLSTMIDTISAELP